MATQDILLEFTKMHGIGNDYVYIDCFRQPEPANLESLSIAMSDRHTGVGGDGIILIEPSDKADCRMRIFNADGSEAMMCGNGIRCVARYYHDHINPAARKVRVDTRSGVKDIDLLFDNEGRVTGATVDMGEPELIAERVPALFSKEKMIEEPVDTETGGVVRLTAVSMGNPHGVVFVDSLDDIDVHATGRELEIHAMWPNRANIEFVEVMPNSDGRDLKMRVWERGSGETMACGTGACATAVAAMLTGRSPRRVTVHLRGGDLNIEWADNGHVMMTGPAEEVFSGIYRRHDFSARQQP